MKLQGNETALKLSLYFDEQSKDFVLFINDLAFFLLPYQAEAVPQGPQNILGGQIYLNGKKVHDGWAQYYSGFVEDMCVENKISSITQVEFEYIECSSAQVINSLLDDIGCNIEQEQGIKTLVLSFGFYENNIIQ